MDECVSTELVLVDGEVLVESWWKRTPVNEMERQRELAGFLCRALGRQNVRVEEHDDRGVRVFIWDGNRNHPVWLNENAKD